MGITIVSRRIGHPVTRTTTTTTIQYGYFLNEVRTNTSSKNEFDSGANRWGQAGAEIRFYNESDRDIKYIDFQLVPTNRVGDVVGGIDSVCTVRATGPFRSHRCSCATWNYIWDGFEIKNVCILKTVITYWDGSTETEDNHRYDRALRLTWTRPIVLMLCSLGFFSAWYGSLVSRKIWQFSFANLLPLFSFALMLTFPLLGLFFSRKNKQRLTIIFSALNVSSCIAYIVTAIIGSWYKTTRWGMSEYRSNQWWMSVLLLVISVIPLLKATCVGAFKSSFTSESITNKTCIGVCILVSILFWVILINTPDNRMPAGFISGMFMDLLWIILYSCFLAAIANRFRTTYDIHYRK